MAASSVAAPTALGMAFVPPGLPFDVAVTGMDDSRLEATYSRGDGPATVDRIPCQGRRSNERAG